MIPRLIEWASKIQDAETEIKEIVLSSLYGKINLKEKLEAVIKEKTKQFPIDLRKDAERALASYSKRLISTLKPILFSPVLLATVRQLKACEGDFSKMENRPIRLMGVANEVYHKDYMKRVKEVMQKFAREQAVDRDTNLNLRAKAEMAEREDYHTKQVENLKSKTNLVMCSSHADCSKRCYEWQGRIYSLNGTSGTTADGKKYIPLEKATDIYYTTRAGRTYKNGLLGFGCRHKLSEYSEGMSYPKVTAAQQKKEYAITLRQREYERRIREQKEIAIANKDIDRNVYLSARRKAIALNKRYIEFSRKNERAYYPDRTKII